MASFAPMQTLCAGTTPFEVVVRPHCSRARPSRGRPQQCVRSAGRTSSSRFDSRGSSAGSRSSARSRRPSSEMELRSELLSTHVAPTASVFEALSEDECATGFVSGVLNIAMDDIATEMDYFSDEECLVSPSASTTPMKQVREAAQVLSVDDLVANPSPIAEESEDNDEFFTPCTQISMEERNALSNDMDDLESCDFDDEVCSVASENPDGLEHVDDMLMATNFAKDAVSDDMIRGALTFEDFGEESQDYASGILDGARKGLLSDELAEDHWPDEDAFVSDGEDEEEHHVEFIGEAPFCGEEHPVEFIGEAPLCGEELAFDFASTILDGAIVQAATTWKKHEVVELSTPAPCAEAVRNQSSLESIKEKAKQALLKAAMGRGYLASPVVETKQITNIESLKQMARESLFKAAQVRLKSEAEDLRSQVQDALVKASISGELERALSQVTQKTETIQDQAVAINDSTSTSGALCQALMEATASGKLQAALRQVTIEKEQVTTENEQPAETMPPAEEMLATSKDRNMHSSRSRRRIIGGVVRAPALQQDMSVTSASPQRQPSSKSNRKAAHQGPTSFCMDMGMEPVGKDDSMSGRSSSLTRSYDTLGVQFYSLADVDELPCASPSSGSARKPSKARAKLRAASMSAMAMDLAEGTSRPSSSTSASVHSLDPFTDSTFRGSFTPLPLKLGQNMRPSSSMGSLNLDHKGSFSFKVKQAPGGMLPSLSPEKNSAESIAWSMKVSKTHCNWRNSGLRGSASMIF